MTSVFILLAGKSTRLGGDTPKQYIKIKGKYVFEYSLLTFDSLKEIDQIFLVCDKEHQNFLNEFLLTRTFKHPLNVILGGSTRQESVFNCLKSVQSSSKSDDLVLFHDACRPLIRKHEIRALLETLKEYEAASIATPLYDSLCKESNRIVEKSMKRDNLMKLQTPQGFKFDIIYKAHLEAKKNSNFSFTDDTSVLASNGTKIKLVDGSIFNFKITTKDDLKMFEALAEGFDFD